MFENIGSALTSLESKFAPDVTDDVSRRGASAVTMTDSLICPTSSLNSNVTCCATASAMPVRVEVLNPVISTATS